MASNDRGISDKDSLARDPAWLALRLRERQSVAMTDLFLPAEGRLRDDDRTTIGRLLLELVGRVEQDLRQRLATEFEDLPMLAESLRSPRIPIAWPLLEAADGLRDATLVRVLARRAEEARLSLRIGRERERSREIEPSTGVSPIEQLQADADPRVAEAATSLLVAERCARGGAGEPILAKAELPAEVQHRLVWQVAAALRGHIVSTEAVTPARADRAIARATTAGLAGYDESETLLARAAALARALAAAGRLTDSLIVDALAACHVGFAVAGVAMRTRIGVDFAWDIALDRERLLLLCRAADMAPAAAAMMVVRLAHDGDDDALADSLDSYAALSPTEAASAVGFWRLDPTYLDSVAALAGETAR